jgi:hypothetical protein
VFASVLHRLFVSGSDRACEKWMQDYLIPGCTDLALHHLYRAMAWLGAELEESAQTHRTQVPRCIKDEIEELLFACRQDLFRDLSVVFIDTTTLSFAGAGGATLSMRGHSKEHCPDLKQMVLGMVIDADGRTRPVRLSITHKSGTDCRAECNVGEPREAAPHDHVAGRRISGPHEIAAQPGDPGEIVGERLCV